MRKIAIILGIGFGDEGKGMTVNSLCTDSENTLVIRTIGGHQCGHMCIYDKIRHIFSNFGSGTLKGVPTYWSEYCTVNPVAVIKEGQALIEKGIIPKITYNANAMVTTPFDIIQNHNNETKNNHGTVGVGFGATIQRNEDHYHLYVRDLSYPKIRDEKLRNILNYYHYIQPLNIVSQRYYDEFIIACDKFIEKYDIVENFSQLETDDKDLIFEGGQGIMLDQDFGFFPNVTRSYTTSRNAMEFIHNNNLNGNITTYYVTRAYQTRHGNGYMTNEKLPIISYTKSNPNETNVDIGHQGVFRKAVLDFDIIKYALSCDKNYNNSSKVLVITCLDQITGDDIPITIENNLHLLIPKEIGQRLNIPVIMCNDERGFKLY